MSISYSNSWAQDSGFARAARAVNQTKKETNKQLGERVRDARYG